MPTGRRRSSASWPSSPAVRASSANPRSSSGGRPEVGEGGAAGAGAVERQRPAEHLRVDPADRLEQAQVRAAQPLLVGDRDEGRGAGVGDLVHGMAEAGDEPARRRGPRVTAASASASQPGVVGGQRLARPGQRVGQEPPGVLGDAEEAGAAAEQAGRERALHRVGRAQVGEPGRDRGRA